MPNVIWIVGTDFLHQKKSLNLDKSTGEYLMDKQDIIDTLRDVLSIEIERTRDFGDSLLEIRILVDGDIVSSDWIHMD